jgi:hypothetical protein
LGFAIDCKERERAKKIYTTNQFTSKIGMKKQSFKLGKSNIFVIYIYILNNIIIAFFASSDILGNVVVILSIEVVSCTRPK